jgi:signal transduction histidine kinase
VFHWFRIKLSFYAAGFVALIMGLAYLMYRHTRSEAGLRAAYHRVAEMTGGLTKARDDAIRANRAKSNFLANVSHELRTPLNAIIGFSEMLGGGYCGPLTDKQGEYIGDVHVAAQRLLSLINDILDLSKLEAGKHELTEQAIDLSEIVRQSAHDMREEIRKAGLTAEIDAATAPPAALGDAPKLRQVVDNLLANAIKFTDVGGAIRMSVSRSSDGGVELAVADTGIGIEKDDIPRIFKPFEQIESDHARHHKGTGLGLPLVKGLVELHDGTISVNSTPGLGTVVIVKLPPDRVLPAAQGVASSGDAAAAAASTPRGDAVARPRTANDHR